MHENANTIITGFQTIKMGSKWDVNDFSHFNIIVRFPVQDHISFREFMWFFHFVNYKCSLY